MYVSSLQILAISFSVCLFCDQWKESFGRVQVDRVSDSRESFQLKRKGSIIGYTEPCRKEISNNLVRFLVSFANSGIIKDDSKCLKVDDSFSYDTLKNIFHDERLSSYNIENDSSFFDVVDECIKKRCLSAFCDVLNDELNFLVIYKPVTTLKLPRMHSTCCCMVLREAESGRSYRETAIFINGINNFLQRTLWFAEQLSRACNMNIVMVYNASSGSTIKELIRGLLDAKGYVDSSRNSTVLNIKRALRLVHELNKKEPFMVFAHSDGTSLFHTAMQELDWKHGEEFCYFSAGPACIVESRNFLSAFQVASKRDPIPLITNSLAARRRNNLSTIPASAVSPFLDHTIVSPTYFRQIEKFVDDFRGMSYDYE